MTGWRAAIVWLVAASGIVAIALGQLLNPADWIIVLIIGEVVMSFGLVGAVVVTRMPGNLVGWLVGWLIASRRPGNRIGWVFPAVGLSQPSPFEMIISAFATRLAPVAIGVAIIRYRLHETDRIVSRMVSWAIVTGVLVSVFADGVVPPQAALTPFTQQDAIAVAGLTLVAFALVKPSQRRVQWTVDRRLHRAHYGGQRTVGTFAERLRPDVDLASLRASLASIADQAVRPAGSGVWLREGSR